MEWTDELRQWVPPDGSRRILAVDAHTEGEPLRVVVAGFPGSSTDSVLAWRSEAKELHDGLRRALMWEPRGHADMYGCIVGPPRSAEADIAVLFTHNDGFSTMCGHGIIGVTTVLLETGLLAGNHGELPANDGAAGHAGMATRGLSASAPDEEERWLGIDTPAGFVLAAAKMRDGRVAGVRFRNVPSFAARLDARVDVPGLGQVAYDLAYGGAFYAYVDADELGVALVPGETGRLVDLGWRIKQAVQSTAPPAHPDAEELGFVYGTIFVGEPHDDDHHSRNVCVFADGEVDRCPTGTGVSGRLALHRARGELEVGEEIVVESILGTSFSGRVLSETAVGDRSAVIPEVAGRAWITGINELLLDPSDPLREGFLLR